MKPLYFLPVVSLLIVGCVSNWLNPKDEVFSDDDYTLEAPSTAMSKRTGVPLKDLHTGFSVFVLHCGRCHDYMYPEDVSANDWHKVLPGMAWNAGISKIEEKALMKYLLASKADPNYPADFLPRQ